MRSDQKVAVVTGGCGGIGSGIVEKLLADNVRVCITGRSPQKLETFLKQMQTRFPDSDCSTVLLDVGDCSSVFKAAEDIHKKFKRIDFLFLNAGIMPKSRVRWLNVLKGVFSGKGIHMFLTGEGMLETEKDLLTKDGLPVTFATNVYGHYLLVEELDDLLGGQSDNKSQLIWTSSGSAVESAFDPNDIACLQGKDAYASSKRCIDIISAILNEKMNWRGIYSHAVCPGLVMTNMTDNILPKWFWSLILPLFFFLRIIIRSFTLTTDAGTYGLMWLTRQNPADLKPNDKIFTRASWSGPYLEFKHIEVDEKTRNAVYDELSEIRKRASSTKTS